jgi:hypothetical protein
MPQFHRHFVGLRYTQRNLVTEQLPSIIEQIPDLTTDEQYHSLELWGRFYPHPRLQVFAFVPFNHFAQTNNGATTSKQGLGDATLLLNYALFDTGDSLGNAWKHQLLLGGGVKLPTGKFNPSEDETGNYHPAQQTGTGSWDYLFSALYTLRYQKWGLQSSTGLRLNTANQHRYWFGNRWLGDLRFFRILRKGRTSLIPNLGIQYETNEKDKLEGESRKFTGGESLSGLAGVQFFLGNFSIDFSIQVPVYQHLSAGRLTAGNKFSCNLMYLF